jgi:hypothetical protein
MVYTPGTAPDTCSISAAPHREYDPGAIDIPSAGGSNPDAIIVGSIVF